MADIFDKSICSAIWSPVWRYGRPDRLFTYLSKISWNGVNPWFCVVWAPHEAAVAISSSSPLSLSIQGHNFLGGGGTIHRLAADMLHYLEQWPCLQTKILKAWRNLAISFAIFMYTWNSSVIYCFEAFSRIWLEYVDNRSGRPYRQLG